MQIITTITDDNKAVKAGSSSLYGKFAYGCDMGLLEVVIISNSTRRFPLGRLIFVLSDPSSINR